MSNEILLDAKLTRENSIQHHHYDESGYATEYRRLMEKHNLVKEVRDNYRGYYHEGGALENYTVAPIFDKEGNKICWGMHYPDNSCSRFRTKKEAMQWMREWNPPRSYDDDDDDWEITNYGIDPELGGRYGVDFTDEVGFRD
tara:strand:- start:228 stop:653 length:426 start_codon:yes stop_codon:yes gene_type:complete